MLSVSRGTDSDCNNLQSPISPLIKDNKTTYLYAETRRQTLQLSNIERVCARVRVGRISMRISLILSIKFSLPTYKLIAPNV